MIKQTLVVEAISEIGKIKAVNQDHILVRIGEEKGQEFGIFAVADGMGGLDAGEYASALTIKTISQWWEVELPIILMSKENPMEMVLERLKGLVREINLQLLTTSKECNKKMGTTLSILFLYKEDYCVLHIGDSRIYRINESAIEQITEDHTYVADLVEKGLITSEEAKKHPKRHLLTRCLGATNVEINLYYHRGKINKGESFIISSDGFYNLLHEEEMVFIMKKYRRNIKKGLNQLTKLVYERGANDNLSVVFVGKKTKVNII